MKDTKDFQERYNRWKNGERYWDIRGVELPKYDTGKYVTVEKDDGSVYNVNPNVVNSSEITVTTPEVVVYGKNPNFQGGSAFRPNEAIHLLDGLMGNTIGKVIQPVTKIPGAIPVLRTLTPSNWVGTIRTGAAPWSENNEGFGTSENDQALNSLFNYGMSTAPLKVDALPFLQKLKYSKIGEKARGIKVTDEVYHGSKKPFDISKARTSNPDMNDSGFHVGSNNEPALFMANKDLGGIIYKGKLQLKEPAFEVPDFERWNPYQFWVHAKQNKAFAEYLEQHGLNYEDFGKMSYDMNKGVQQLADKIKNSGIALKYKNKYETLTGNGYSYYLSNPKQAHFTEVMDFGNNRNLFINPYKHVIKSTIADLVGNNQWKPLISDKNKPIYIIPNFYKIQDNGKNRNEDHPVKINLPKYQPGKDGEETLDQKAAKEREFQQKHPFMANVAKNVREIEQGWDNFWDHNLFRYPVMVVSSSVLGAGLQKLARAKKAADLIKLRKDTAHLKPRYRNIAREIGLEPHDEFINTILDAYGRLQQTPVGALLPFDKGKDSIHINPQYQHGKNTMNSFITDIGPLVYQGLKSRGVKNPNAYDYMMRQLAMESGYGGTRYRNSHNYGGVMSKGKLKQFESDQQFVDYYLNLMNNKYRDAVSAKDLRQYAEQLGKQGYYNGPTVQQYYDKLNGLKTYGRLLQNDLNKNRNIYEQNSGIQVNPQTNQAQFIQPIPIEQQPAQIPLIKPQDLKMLTVPINQIKIPNLNFK